MMNRTIKLSSGYEIPTIGLGTWKSKPNEVGNAVKYALSEAGYTHIDGAAAYHNEAEIGEVYQEIFQSVKREEVFITSKLWNTNHGAKHVAAACRKTLRELRLDYLDLYLIHWDVAFRHIANFPYPVGLNGKMMLADIPLTETWAAMELLVKEGLVKSIGVANFTQSKIENLLTFAKIKPAVNQVELHPYNSQAELVEYCQKRNIAVTAYSPLGRQGTTGVSGPRLFDEPLIQELAQKYGKTLAQIILNWALSRGTIAIPKSVTPIRIKENIGVYDFELSPEDIKQINSLNRNFRFVDPSSSWGITAFEKR